MKLLHCDVGFVSEPGNQRPDNQDSLIVRRGQLDGRDFVLLAVADGMGGMSQGDRASCIAALLLGQWWEGELPTLLTQKPFSWENLSNALTEVISHINQAIRNGNTTEEKSGTTLSLLFYMDGRYLLRQVGDSRIYLLRQGQVFQVTKDQTWCQQEIDHGRLTPEEALTHKMRHVLISALGIREDYICQESWGEAMEGDWLLVCSDGFYNELDVATALPAACQKGEPQKIVEGLLARIKAGRAGDNVSAILAHVTSKRKWL